MSKRKLKDQARTLPREQLWNRMILLRDTTSDARVQAHAEMLLTQWNTAGGSILMKQEFEQFLNKHGL